MENYPPGVTDRDFENPYGDLREQIEDNADIRYELAVFVNDEYVYSSDFHSEEALQEEGLRKAEHAIEEELTRLTDMKWEERK